MRELDPDDVIHTGLWVPQGVDPITDHFRKGLQHTWSG